jgi:heterodisulfide reductase subunit A-like polyferredoxin
MKNRLLRQGGYDPKDMIFVNIKETCLIPFKDDRKVKIEHTMRVIQSGLWQLKEHKTVSVSSEEPYTQALILGSGETGIEAAKALKIQFPSVVVVENQDVDKEIEAQLREYGINLVCPVRPIRLDGQRGNFTLIVEEFDGPSIREKDKRVRNLDSQFFDKNPGYQKIQAGVIMLGRNEFKNIPYRRDAFERESHARFRKAFGTLETGIPGVYMASWPQVRHISNRDMGNAAASEALEGTFGRVEPSGYFVARVDAEFCRGCGRCADICPEGAARLEETTRGVASCWIELGLCTGCGCCIAECPTGAISIPEYDQTYFEKVINAFLG